MHPQSANVQTGPAVTSYGGEHVSKLGKLVLQWSNILCTVTSVELGTSPLQDGPLEALGKTYMLLAEACPDLQHLRIDGNLPRLVLGHFGQRCSKLTSLEVEQVCDGTFLGLQLLLPNLRHIKVLQPGRDAPTQPGAQHPPRPDTAFVDRSICALTSCSALTSLHVGRQKLSHEVWRLLPRSLKVLHASLDCPPPVNMDAFPALQHMHIHFIQGGNLNLKYLTALVRGAPNLRTLTLPTSLNTSLQVECVPEVLPDLVYLEGRLRGGLRAQVKLYKEGSDFGNIPIALCRVTGVVGAEDSSISDFLASLPCLPALHSIKIDYASSLPQRRQKDMQQVARAFPNLDTLFLTGNLCDADIIPLAACTKLWKLVLLWTSVTSIGLAVFCSHLPTLRMLVSIEPTQGMLLHGVALTELLREWGLTTVVCVLAKQ